LALQIAVPVSGILAATPEPYSRIAPNVAPSRPLDVKGRLEHSMNTEQARKNHFSAGS
jgi:hypothetical protein